MHETCERIVDSLGDRQSPHPLRRLLSQLSSSSIRVTSCLERLETRLLIEEICGRPGSSDPGCTH